MLHKLQQDFLNYVRHEDTSIIDAIKTTGTLSPQQRLNIYRNNTNLILTDVLISTFPAVTSLVDEKFMRYACHMFIQENPPQSGDMSDYGKTFISFLKTFSPLAPHPYLESVARVEWAWQESYLSHKYPATDHINNQIILQPHVRLLKFEYPAIDIWQFAMTKDNDDIPPPDIKHGTYFGMTYRNKKSVDVWKLTEDGFSFLQNGVTEKNIDNDFIKDCINANIFAKETQ